MRNDFKGITKACLTSPIEATKRCSLEQNPDVARGIGASLATAMEVTALKEMARDSFDIILGSARNPQAMAALISEKETGPKRGMNQNNVTNHTYTP